MPERFTSRPCVGAFCRSRQNRRQGPRFERCHIPTPDGVFRVFWRVSVMRRKRNQTTSGCATGIVQDCPDRIRRLASGKRHSSAKVRHFCKGQEEVMSAKPSAERCPSGLRCSPGKTVFGKTEPRVRISPAPPEHQPRQGAWGDKGMSETARLSLPLCRLPLVWISKTGSDCTDRTRTRTPTTRTGKRLPEHGSGGFTRLPSA